MHLWPCLSGHMTTCGHSNGHSLMTEGGQHNWSSPNFICSCVKTLVKLSSARTVSSGWRWGRQCRRAHSVSKSDNWPLSRSSSLTTQVGNDLDECLVDAGPLKWFRTVYYMDDGCDTPNKTPWKNDVSPLTKTMKEWCVTPDRTWKNYVVALQNMKEWCGTTDRTWKNDVSSLTEHERMMWHP